MSGARRGPFGWPLHIYFVLLLALFTAATLVALFVVRSETRSEALDSARADAAFAAERASSDLEESLEAARGVIGATAANPAIASLLDAEASCNLSFANVGPLVGSINVLHPDGSIGCSSVPEQARGYEGLPWLSDAFTGLVTTEPFLHPEFGNPVFAIAAPVDDGRAILAAVIELAPIAPALSERYGGPTALEFVVLAPDGSTVLSRSIDGDAWAGVALDDAAVEGLVERERPDFDGTTRIYEVSTLPGDAWQVHAGADKAGALAGANRVFERFGMAIGAGLLVALIASVGVYFVTVRPIRRLSQGVGSAAMDPAHGGEVAVGGPAEIADLAGEFNRLTASVQEEFARREAAELERDELRNQLSRIERLESLGQLAGGMAHDFNNMLGVMLNYAVFVKEEVEQAAREDAERWGPVLRDIDEIEATVERSAGLTRQLLAFARCDIARPANLNVNETIESLQPLLTRTLGENVRLDLSLSDTVDPVQIDPSKLEQVLVNLATNARDAMPGGGTLAIDSATVEVDEEYASSRPNLEPGRYVRLRVSDTGTGMEPKVMEHAFEPLFTTKSAGRGTGLGLSTVHGIVSQSGGQVSIYSEPGEGTTFSILLPVAQGLAQVQPPRELAESTGLGGSETVLVVEDDSSLLDVANRILASHGYRTLTAMTGADAIAEARRHQGVIDVLVTDMVLPDMSGRDLALRLEELRPHLRVVYASGYAAPILAARAAIGPESIVLEKPFPAGLLLSKVRAALAS